MAVSVVLVGLGDIGLSAHLPAILRHPEFELVGLVDPDPVARAAAADRADGVPTVSQLAELRPAAADAAMVLATPPWVTTELAAELAGAGRFVLAEKPIVVDLESARRLIDLPAAVLARIQLGLTYRHHPTLARLKEWVDAGLLGSPLLVRAHIYDERRDPAAPQHFRRLIGTLDHGSPAVHEGAHLFDWLAFLFGPDIEVTDGWELRSDPDFPTPNLTGARLALGGGHVALVEFGWLTDALPRCELTLLGQRGLATLNAQSFQLRLTTADHDEIVEPAGDRVAKAFDRQPTAFLELIRGGVAAPSVEDGLRGLRLAARVAEMSASNPSSTALRAVR